MFGSHYYNKNIRNIVVLFGTLFNDISVKRVTSAGVTSSEFKVPIAYGPSEKFLAKIGGKDELSLPRFSFEITDYAYDPTRKLQTTKKLKKGKAGSTTRMDSLFNPVPYDFSITLSLMVKYSDDGTQILEQILPYFTPDFQVAMNEISTLGIIRDIPIILNSVTTEDTYEGDFITRRALIHTLQFTVKGHIYGRTSDQSLIRTVDANITGTSFDNPTIVDGALVGDKNIEIKPRALSDLNNDEVIDNLDHGLVMPDNDFGFIETITEEP